MRAVLASGGAALLLGGLAWHGPALPELPLPSAPAAAPPPRAVAALAPAQPGPWPEQLARPLFEPTRRPPVPPGPAASDAPAMPEPPPPLAASGIVIGPAGPVALLRLADGRMVRAPQGGEVEGWEVARIGATAVEMRRGPRIVALSVRLGLAGETTPSGDAAAEVESR